MRRWRSPWRSFHPAGPGNGWARAADRRTSRPTCAFPEAD
jgi:hypothetical protein